MMESFSWPQLKEELRQLRSANAELILQRNCLESEICILKKQLQQVGLHKISEEKPLGTLIKNDDEENKRLQVEVEELKLIVNQQEIRLEEAEEIMKQQNKLIQKYEKEKATLKEAIQLNTPLREKQEVFESEQTYSLIKELQILSDFPEVKKSAPYLEQLKEVVEYIKQKLVQYKTLCKFIGKRRKKHSTSTQSERSSTSTMAPPPPHPLPPVHPSSSTMSKHTSGSEQEEHPPPDPPPPPKANTDNKKLPDPLKNVTKLITKSRQRQQRHGHGEDVGKVGGGSNYPCLCGLSFEFKLHLDFHMMQAAQNRSFKCLSYPRRFHPYGQFTDREKVFPQTSRSCSQSSSVPPPAPKLKVIDDKSHSNVDLPPPPGGDDEDIILKTPQPPENLNSHPSVRNDGGADLGVTSQSLIPSPLPHPSTSTHQTAPPYDATSEVKIGDQTTTTCRNSLGRCGDCGPEGKGEHICHHKMYSSKPTEDEEMDTDQEIMEVPMVTRSPTSSPSSEGKKYELIDLTDSPEAFLPESDSDDEAIVDTNPTSSPSPQPVSTSQTPAHNANARHRANSEVENKCICGVPFRDAEALQAHINYRNGTT